MVIGGGPAGLTAALYLARARYRVVVVEKDHFGGQITITSEVVNYPGVGRTSGTELTETMRKQAEGFGAEFLLAEVTGLELSGDIKTVRTGRGDLRCFGVLLATGAHPRMVGFQGEEQFRGRGVAYCATCDGAFFKDKDVVVIGGGNSALEESLYLTTFAKSVTIVIRRDVFRAEKQIQEQIEANEKIHIIKKHIPKEILSENGKVSGILLENVDTQETMTLNCQGIFPYVGQDPMSQCLEGLDVLDDRGYVLVDKNMETKVKGIYAAGDVLQKDLRQVVTATNDGAIAAQHIFHEITGM